MIVNERIRELAEQATDKWVGGQFFDREKFAELIVRDCARTAGLMEHLGRKGIGAQILDNYGVEE
jgi:hypothetical protein